MKALIALAALALGLWSCTTPSYSWNSEQSPDQAALARRFGFEHIEVTCGQHAVEISGYFSKNNAEPVVRVFDNVADQWNGLNVRTTFCEPWKPGDYSGQAGPRP